jgi:tetratricopeptide (TPR) repeat protein
MRLYLTFLLLTAVFLLASSASAEVIRFKDGDEVTGKIIEETDKLVKVKTRYGELIIPREDIESIKKHLVRVILKKEKRIGGELIEETNEYVVLKTKYGELTIPRADIEKIEEPEAERDEKMPETPETTSQELESAREKAMDFLKEKKYEDALKEFAKILREIPDDSNALYNSACAYSLLGDKAKAVEFLENSVKAGFLDFDHIEKDPDLDNIREDAGYKAIIAAKEKYIADYASESLARLKKRLGDEYRVIEDKDYKLIVASNVEQETLNGLIDALHEYADALWREFFKNKPNYYITVLIPKNMEDYARKFGGGAGAAGFYNTATRTLTVNLATGGGTMIHEFTHALHYADMSALKQSHPIWIIEGFGSLYEQCRVREGSPIGLLNWRLPILQSAIGTGDYISWERLMKMSGAEFGRDRKTTSVAYAESRYIFYFLQEKKLLKKFYEEYTKNYSNDKSGIAVIESVTGKKLAECEKEWLEFVKGLKSEARRTSGAYLGVGLEDTDEGLTIQTVAPDSPAEKAGLKEGDIIVELDGEKIKSREDLLEVLSKKKPDDKVTLKAKRGSEEVELTVTLGRRR